jgi:MFS family permease
MPGAPLAALFFILVPLVRGSVVLIALAILGTSLCMALFRSPTVAYLGDLVRPAERSKSSGVINLMGGLGGAFALLGGGAGVMLIAIGIVVAFVKEPSSPDQPTTEREPGIWASAKRVATGVVSFCWPRSSPGLWGVTQSWRSSRSTPGTSSECQRAPARRC